MLLQIITLALVASLVSCHQHDEPWAHNVMYYQQLNLTCQKPGQEQNPLTAGNRLTWILPSGEILHPGEMHPRVEIGSHGQWLNIKRANDADFGVYNCLTFVNDVLTYNIRVGVNIHGSYWGDMYEKYLPNIVTGGIACGITFAVALIMCYCYEKQQNRGENAIDAYEQMMRETLEQSGKDNDAYVEMEALPEKNPPSNSVEASPLDTAEAIPANIVNGSPATTEEASPPKESITKF